MNILYSYIHSCILFLLILCRVTIYCISPRVFVYLVTELPVEKPDFSDRVKTDLDSPTHFYTPPNFGPANVTLLPGINYFYHGGEPTVDISVPGEPYLAVGTHTITTVIADTELSSTSFSTLTVIGIFEEEKISSLLTEIFIYLLFEYIMNAFLSQEYMNIDGLYSQVINHYI